MTDATGIQAERLDALAARIEEDAEQPEAGADACEQALAIPPESENRRKARETVLSFVSSYRDKDADIADEVWLDGEFARYPSLWGDAAERKGAALVIVERVRSFEAEKQKLAECKEKGLSRESYLRSAIETGAKAQGITDFGKYAGEIDHALDKANRENIELMYRMDGGISQQPNLDGFIAEQHHVDSFNLKAAAAGSPCRAEVLKPAPGEAYGKNSVDIVIRDDKGRIVKKYQAKYGADAESTGELFEKGDYRGQRKLVPKGQAGEIPGSTESIEYDGIESDPLSKEEAKVRQRKIQEAQEAKQYEWNDVNRKVVARNIAGKARVAALCAVGFQGARILGRRIWNSVTGKENKSVEEDAAEFAESALESGASAGLTVAATGGVTVVIKSGWLGNALKATPVARIADAVCIGIENTKILVRFARGEISGEEAVDQAGEATCSLVGSLALGVKGAAVGAAVGTALGPLGTVAGGIVGGMVGGIAGSTVGKALWEGGKAVAKTAAKTVRAVAKGVAEGVKNVASSAWNAVCSFFS
jgi:hypothetical protein